MTAPQPQPTPVRRFVRVEHAAPLGLFGDPPRYEVPALFPGLPAELWQLTDEAPTEHTPGTLCGAGEGGDRA